MGYLDEMAVKGVDYDLQDKRLNDGSLLGQPNGVATLGQDGKVPSEQLPSSGGGDDGSFIWTTTVAPTTSSSNYTFAISDLTGPTGKTPKVGDIILYSYYRFTISSVDTTTVLAGSRQSLRGSSGAAGTSAVWFTGTAVTGTGTGISAAVSGSKAGDMYLNTTSCNVYSATAADTWNYSCNIKGSGGSGSGTVTGVKVGPNGEPISPDGSGVVQIPAYPAEQIQSDWNQTTASAKDYIKNKPTIPTVPEVFGGSGDNHSTGLVPDPGATAGTTKFLREDGSWQVPAGGSGGGDVYNVPNTNTKTFVEQVLAQKSNTSTVPTILNFGSSEPYIWDGILYINKKNVKLTGGGTIQGHLHLGYTKEDYTELDYDAYPSTGHHCISVENLTFNKYNIIGTDTNDTTIENFVKNGDYENVNHVSISLVNVNHVKITNCFFDNVPYPIVYTPNSTYVNQNVRRLNISNCDFERCKMAVYAPSILDSSLEYGDLEFNYCNVFPYQCGLEVHCIDGFKVMNSVFNTGTNKTDWDSVNIKAVNCGQCVITGNSFYGEYNKHGLLIVAPGNLNISSNTFASQHTAENLPSFADGAGIVRVYTRNSNDIVNGLSINGNLFTKCIGVPIVVEGGGQMRGISITGNSVDLQTYSSYERTIYSIPTTYARTVCAQRSHTQLLMSRYFMNARLEAIDDYRNAGVLRESEAVDFFKGRVYADGGRKFGVKKVTKTYPIVVITVNSVPSTGVLSFMFDGVMCNLDRTGISTATQLLNAVKDKIDTVFGSSYDTSIIDGLLYVKGKTSAQEIRSLFRDMSAVNAPETTQSINCLYENMGYRVDLCDVDGKNFIRVSADPGNPLGYTGIDIGDDGKQIIVDHNVNVLSCVNNTSKDNGQILFRSNSSNAECYIFNDTYLRINTASRTSSVLPQIIQALYSDWFTISVDTTNDYATLTYVEENKEYEYNTTNWTATSYTHTVNVERYNGDGEIII